MAAVERENQERKRLGEANPSEVNGFGRHTNTKSACSSAHMHPPNLLNSIGNPIKENLIKQREAVQKTHCRNVRTTKQNAEDKV